jgi:hypothetical protein
MRCVEDEQPHNEFIGMNGEGIPNTVIRRRVY